MHGVDVSRRVQQVPPTDGEAEVGDADQRLHARLMAVGVMFSENAEILAGNMETILNRDMERAQLNFALESIRKRLNNAGAKDRARVVSGNYQNGREDNSKDECRPE